MKKLSLLMLLFLVLFAYSQAGNVVSLNFPENTNQNFTGGQFIGPLGTNSAFWNRTNNTAPNTWAVGTALNLTDSGGLPTGINVSWLSSGTYWNADGTSTDERKLSVGYLDDGDPNTANSIAEGLSITLTNIPYASYNVYGLFASDSGTSMVNFDVNGTWALGGDETTIADAYGTVVSCYTATGKYWVEVVPGVTRGNYWKVSTSGSTCTIIGRPRNGSNRGSLTGIVIESSEGYQGYKRSLSSNFVYTEGSGGWGYHWYLVNSSNPGAGYYDPNGLLFDQAPSKTWNEGRPAKGAVWKLKNELGSTTFGPAYMVNNQDFYWYTSWYQNIDNFFNGSTLALTGTAWDLQDNKNLARMVVGFVGHNNGTPQKSLSTVKKVPYGDYMCVVYMNPNVTDFQQVLSIENKIYYYQAENANVFKERLKTEPNQPRWLMATETVSPATKKANLAIFRHLSKPDMDMIYDSIGANSGISAYQIISEELDRDVAAVPSPASSDKTLGGIPASINTLLTWQAPVNYTPTSYDLYIGVYGDPNWALTPAATGLTTASFDPALNYGTPYVWRVDSHDSATIHTGDLWYFDVEGDPVIMRQPVSTATVIGESTFFSVTALLTETYSWYRSTDAVNNTPADDALLQSGTSNTLTLANIQDTDFVYYYCVLQNTIPGSVKVYTNVAELVKGKIEAYWKFDGDPNDSVATWHGTPATITDPSVAVKFDETGIDGQAARFFRTGNQIVITGSETYFNFYPKGFTANFWVKPDNYDTVGGFMTYIAKRTGSTGWNLYDTAIYYGVGYEATIYPLGIGTPVGRLDDGNWHMLTATYDGATRTMKTYSDGFLSGTPAVGDLATPLSTGPVTIGSYNTTGTGGWSYSGLLDDVRIYSYELKAIEIASLYAEMTGTSFCFAPIAADLNGDCKVDLYDVADLASQWLDSTDPGTVPMTRVVHWNFDETSGLTATDSSGNGIDGALGAGFANDGNAQWVVDGGRTGNAGDNALYINGDPNTAVIATVANPNSLANGADNIFLGTALWTMNIWVKYVGTPTTSVNIGGFGQNEWLDPSVNSDRYFASYGDYAGYEVELGQDGIWPSNTIGPDWQMLTATYDGTTCIVYYNGEEYGRLEVALVDTFVNEINLNTARRILWDSGAVPMHGYVDDFSIWSEAFGPTQVMGMYTNDFPSCDGSLEADTNGDCRVDIVDFALLASNWLVCNIVPQSDCL